MKTSDFQYDLPEELIAQTPITPRDASRMLVCNRENTQRQHAIFRELPDFLRAGDVMVINQTKVIPARLLGVKEETGVPVEVLLLKRTDKDTWEALVHPGRRLREHRSRRKIDRLLVASGDRLGCGVRECSGSIGSRRSGCSQCSECNRMSRADCAKSLR